MYQLQQKNNNQKFGSPLLTADHNIVLGNLDRTCTDVLCLVLFLAFFGAFIGLLSYGLIRGNVRDVFAVYNSNHVKCEGSFAYGLFADSTSLNNAICVSQCPSKDQEVSCLKDSDKCAQGLYKATVDFSSFEIVCVRNVQVNGVSITSFFSYNSYSAWAFDLQRGYLILIGAAVAAMISSLLFLFVIRRCAKIMIWLAIFICILGLQVIGILFILQAKGVRIAEYVNIQVGTLSFNTLIIIGSGLIGAGAFMLLLAICLRSRIGLGSKAVEMGAVFLLQNCCMVMLPITQAIFITGAIAALVIGAVAIYSLGSFTFPNNIAFPVVSFSQSDIVVLAFFLAGGLWTLFWLQGSNHFTLSSAVSIWYFNHENTQNAGRPFGDSIKRLVRFHAGSVAFTSLINGVFFVVKIVLQLFSFEVKQGDNSCTTYCLRCLNCFFCIFRIFLRFLADGVYVQMAVFGTGYCTSTMSAFDIISQNSVKLTITQGISFFFTILGIFGISVTVSIGAYLSCLQIEYFAKVLTNPLIVTIVSGLIAFVIAAIYLSMIDMSSQSVMQCYLIDNEHHNGQSKFARSELKQMLLEEQN